MTLARVRIGAAGALAVVALLVQASQPARAASSCQTSSPSSRAYSVTVCISQPASGTTVSGAVPVSATISVSGSNPGVSWPLFYLDGTYFSMSWVISPAQITIPTASRLSLLRIPSKPLPPVPATNSVTPLGLWFPLPSSGFQRW